MRFSFLQMRWLRQMRRLASAMLVLAAMAYTMNLIRLPEPAAVAWVPIAPRLQVVYAAPDGKGPVNSAHAAILLENTTGTILYGKNEHVPRAPASLTKIMTAILALESGRLSDVVTVSRRAAALGGSSVHLYAGQQIRLEDLMYAMLLRSGNDAAVAVAEHIGGTLPAFIELMNQRARELGATRTHFVNPHGLDKPGHFSTAFDLAMLSRVALLYPRFAAIVGTQQYTYAERDVTWNNTNRLLWSYAGAEGIKTGTTGQAGNCLAAAASRSDMQLIAIVLGSNNRWRDAVNLFEYGFQRFSKVVVAEKGVPLAQVKLRNSTRPLAMVPADNIAVIVQKSDHKGVSSKLVLNQLSLPIRKGARLGVYEVYSGSTKLATIPLTAAAPVYRNTLWRAIGLWLSRLF